LPVEFLLQDAANGSFWIAALQIIGVNVILSGDNAVVIAMACLTLPPRQRLWGMVLGAGVAVLLRVIFTLVVAQAMAYPFLKLVGGALLFWVAVKLVIEDAEGEEGGVEAGETLWRAVRIVAIADIVMSLDNVIAIAAAADVAAAQVDGIHATVIKTALIIFGLATSVPLIVAGSAILMALLERFKVLVWAGGALLGWVAGEIMSTDPAVLGWLGEAITHDIHVWGGRVGALIVVLVGLWIIRRHRPLVAEEIWTLVALLVWVAGDIAIAADFDPAEGLKRWSARLVLFLILLSDYVVLRSRTVAPKALPHGGHEPVAMEPRREREKERV
jgi:YjbE family integral membrane protein